MKGRLRPFNPQVAGFQSAGCGFDPHGPTTLNSAFAVRRLAGRWPRPHGAHTILRGRPCGGVHPVGQGAEVVRLLALAPTRQRLGEGGRQPDSLDEAGRWSTPLWTYAVFAVVIYSRAAADRLGVTVGEFAKRTHGDTGSSS
jgi:hypothetical protein